MCSIRLFLLCECAVTDSITIQPIGPFSATANIPGSKSLTNRALLLAALADGQSTLTGLLRADDPDRMIESLGHLGCAPVIEGEPTCAVIDGCDGKWPRGKADLFIGNAGTAARFLAAACCLAAKDGDGETTLDGIPRMRQRPIGELVEALRTIGASIDYLGDEGFPPLRIHGRGLRGGTITMPSTLSSQFISALLQVGPYCDEGLTIRFDGSVTSQPYVEMTLRLMEVFGAQVEVGPNFTSVSVAAGGYTACDYHVEPDASNASYFLAAAALVTGSKCTVEGLGFKSLQGDAWFAERVLQPMGASVIYEPDAVTVMSPPAGESLKAIDVDLNHLPDMAQTLATLALFADGTSIIRNIGNLRVKETDRLAALQIELTKLGADVEIDGDDLIITPPDSIQPAAIDTYDDHRMAMSFAIVGLRAEGVTINDPACVNKTFPTFFDELAKLGAAASA